MRFVFLLLIIPYLSFGQQVSKKAMKCFEKGRTSFNQEAYEAAIKSFDKAIGKDPQFTQPLLYKAYALHRMDKYDEAINAYKSVIKIDPKNKAAMQQLALLYRSLGEFETALDYTDIALTTKLTEKERASTILRSEELIFAIKAKSKPKSFDPKPIGDAINTSSFSEYLPYITLDGGTLIFTRRLNGQEDIYESKLIDGNWTEGSPINEINTPGNEGAFCIFPDGQTIIFSGCGRSDVKGRCDLFITTKKGNEWAIPQNMGPPINSNAKDFQPSISSDGKTLFFTSSRKGGLGSTDIWASHKDANGKWGIPLNLGPSINTSNADESPFIHPDNQTLYFMSKGHPGFGDFDLFKSSKTPFGEWQTVENLGYPINSPGNEGALFVNAIGDKAYFSTDQKYFRNKKIRKPNEYYEVDIYQFDLDPSLRPNKVSFIKGQIINQATNQPISGEIEVFNPTNDQVVQEIKTSSSGLFTLPIVADTEYGILVNKTGFSLYSNNFIFSKESINDLGVELKIYLIPLEEIKEEPSEPIVLRNVFFETGSSNLLSSSSIELDKLASFLKENNTISIQIEGHTDNVGQPSDNQILSEHRAKAVYDYLLNFEFGPNRLSYRGFGETQPIDNNQTEKGKQANRRVAFRIKKNG